jgi:hypothetical protein
VGVVASLVPTTVTVEPGGQAVVLLRLRNTGSIVDRFDVTVVGPTAAWARVDPPSLSLFPGAEGETRVVFAPPRASEPRAGTLPFGLRITPEADPRGGTVEEGRVTVEPFTDVVAQIVPQTSRGSRAGKHEVVVENRGNAPVAVDMLPSDPDRLLSFSIPNAAAAPGGGARFSVGPAERGYLALVARPVDSFLRGQKQTLPFTVDIKAGAQPPLQLRASLVQGPVLPTWLLPLGGLAAAGALAIAFLPGLLGSGTPRPDSTDLVITPTPLITPSPTPEPTPSPTPEPTEAPPVTPKPQTAQTSTIQFRGLGMEDPLSEGSGNPTLAFRSEGPGDVIVKLDRITTGSAGIRVCLKPGGCKTLKNQGDVAQARSDDDGAVAWTVTVDVAQNDSIPTVDLSVSFPSNDPTVTFTDNAMFSGDSLTSGFTTLMTPLKAGPLEMSADFNGSGVQWRSKLQNITQNGSTQWSQEQATGFDGSLSLTPAGLAPQTTYLFDWFGTASLDGNRVTYSATIAWP